MIINDQPIIKKLNKKNKINRITTNIIKINKNIMNRLIIGFLFFGLMSSCQRSSINQQAVLNSLLMNKRGILNRNTNLMVSPRFTSLSPGSIRPEGWIKDWAVDASKGITGHLDEWDPVFGKGWTGQGFKALGADSIDGTGWPLEQCSYWLDGAVRLAYILNDSALIKKVSSRLNLIVDGVLHDGESFIYWKPKDFVKDDGFNSWAHGQMGRALTAYYQSTGDKRVLEALVKVYSQYPLPALPDRFDIGVTGAINADAMLETYRMSGDERILRIILDMAKTEKFRNTVAKWNNGELGVGHAVGTYENILIPALIYPWTGDKSQLMATENCFEWIDKNNLLPYGLSSGEEHNAGIGSIRNTETCNVSTAARTFQQVFEITGNIKYADKIEKIFFNAAPAPVERDFNSLCYYQSPNRIQNVIPIEEPMNPNGNQNPPVSSYVFRPVGYPVLCCVGNLNRTIPNYIMHMWMATFNNGLAATLYGPSTVKTIVGEQNTAIKIVTDTNYPFDEKIEMSLFPDKKTKFPLYLRIPGWCSNPHIQLNGEEVKYEMDNGFAKIERTWEKTDKIALIFPMEVQVLEGSETPYPRTPYFERSRMGAKLEKVSNPFQSVFYGPLLFALPIADIDANTQEEGAKWNYALAINDDISSIEVLRSPMPSHWAWPLDAPLKLKVNAATFNWNPTELQPLPAERVKGINAEKITLVPYGCTKFRVSMFPIAVNNQK